MQRKVVKNMNEKINKLISELTELNFKHIVLKSYKDIVILFYDDIETEKIIYGLSIDEDSLYIDIGNLVEENNGNIILGCTHRLFNNLNKKKLEQIVHQIQELIEKDEQAKPFNIAMKSKQKFSDLKNTIKCFLREYNYSIYN